MAHTIELSGNLLKKTDGTATLTYSIDPKITYTEYTENEITVVATSTSTINLGGITAPLFFYAETDNPVTIKFFKGANVIASALPLNSSLLITPNAGGRFGTVSVTNSGASDADVKIFIAG